MAQYQSKYASYVVKAAGKQCKFKNHHFETEDPAVINALANNLKFNIDFFRIDSGSREEMENDNEWRDHLIESDDISRWSTLTIKALKNEEEIFRCPNKCGYGTHKEGMIDRHLKDCPKGQESEGS